MITLRFSFLAGRFHATPWNRQVNEGEIEWPPQPWRIMRALIFTYHMKLKEEFGQDMLTSLVDKLSDSPLYYIPKAGVGHTRHYMPLYHIGKTSKIFDTFAALDHDDAVLVSWPDVDLEIKEKNLLKIILERLNYLGRAESWVHAEIVDDSFKPNCFPLADNENYENFELIDVLVPLKEHAFQLWKEEYLKTAGKNSKKFLKKMNSMMDALSINTSILKKQGWSNPPGSKWVQYLRPVNCFDISPSIRYVDNKIKKPTLARFALASQVPPRLTDSVSLADRIHKTLVSRTDGSVIFTGCDEEGKPVKGHNHAYILGESNLALGKGKRGEITHVSLYAPAGFGIKERIALDGLVGVWGKGGHDIQLVLIGIGDPADFGGLEVLSGKAPILAESNVWISRTPFVPNLHPKFTRSGIPKVETSNVNILGMKKGLVHKGSPEHNIIKLLKLTGYPEPVSIERIDNTVLAGRKTRWLEFRRDRYGGNGVKGMEIGYGFIIEFPVPVRGPIALGYGAHFGLGLFVPDDSEKTGEP